MIFHVYYFRYKPREEGKERRNDMNMNGLNNNAYSEN